MKKLKAKISMILNGAKFKKNHLHINYTSFGNCVILYSHCFQLSKYHWTQWLHAMHCCCHISAHNRWDQGWRCGWPL